MGEQERGGGVPSPVEEGYTSICLSCAASLLASARDEVSGSRGGIVLPMITKGLQSINLVENSSGMCGVMQNEHFVDAVQQRRAQGRAFTA